ncbi:LytR/AlgR family response regulator transcription factor [Maribellus mangrovi]|uniref:LytR/AlgR family response regulator transcription factor n=1 Tax=Maribellus mangrovi TaxID=3133146 RepID=UPI0030ECA85A
MDIKCVIVDDELNNIENLQGILKKCCNEFRVVDVATNADDAFRKINLHQPDLIFLDIQMPGKSGFDLLKMFQEINFEIIFVTAYDKYGIQAIKFSALDYLLKPIDIDDLRTAVEKAKKRITQKKQNLNIENLMEFIKRGQNESPKIALPTFNEVFYVETNEIIRCEALDNYTTFYLRDKTKIVVSKPLKEYAEILQSFQFIRTHQSHLINIHFVKSFLKEDGGKLLMKDSTTVPISRQKRNFVKDALGSFASQ